MKEKLELIPFLKIYATLLLGIIFATTIAINISVYALCAIIIPLALYFYRPTIASYALLFLLGASLPYLNSEEPLPLNKECTMEMIVTDTSIRKEVYTCHLKELDASALIIFRNSQQLGQGDTLRAVIILEELQYAHHQTKKLAADKNTKLSAKVTNLIEVRECRGVYRKEVPLPQRINLYLSNRLNGLNISPSDIGIINGMLLGNREMIDKEKQEQYAITGISHLLSISGMHIGIIFFIFNILFVFRNKTYYGKVIGSVAIITLLWIYTIIVGSPVSALRATMMFTILQVSMVKIFSPLQIFNTLFATATLFTLIDYRIIYDIGFQLSFVSVLSILIFMSLLPRKNYFIDILAVTLSAQVLTTPLVLHYFGYFSLISTVANIFGSLVIYLIIVAAIGYIIYPNVLLEWAIRVIFDSFNYILKFLSELPFSHIDNVNFSVVDIIIYYVIVYLIYDIIVSSTKKAV